MSAHDLLDRLDERLGYRAPLERLRSLRVGGGPRWAHVPGTVLLGLIAIQFVTGVALASFYAPGTASAWGSVFFLEEHVVLGSLLRGLHAFGAGAIVALMGLHLVSAGLRQAYRAPREVAWLLGLALVPLILGFALTGYLLPWDQKGYWATKVATGIMRGTPLVGDAAARVFQGGPDLGNLTLTRFYALHTHVLPLGLFLLLALHLRALARAPREATAEARPYWPHQAWRDLLALALVLGLVTFLASGGAGLEAPADPSSDYPPRPEWFFAPLRQLLMLAPEPWGSLVIPGLVGATLAALPWIDGAGRPRPRLAKACLIVPALAYLLLGAQAYMTDASDADFQAARQRAQEDAELARLLAVEQGVPGAGPAEILGRHPPRWGRRLFELHCQSCHPLEGAGGDEAPDLTGYLSSEWLQGVVRDPRAPAFFGLTPIDGMDPLPREFWPDLRPLAAYLQSLDPSREGLDPALVARGSDVFDEQECFSCHSTEAGDFTEMGPTLADYGSEAWLLDFLRDPGQPQFYGEDNEMPAYGEELSEAELRALVAFLRTLDGRAFR